MKLTKLFASITLLWISCLPSNGQKGGVPIRWGDQGNGTYINPILNSDYSDPDVIRVGKSYYMVASDFNHIGMQVLKSDDMVNWQVISQIYNRFDLPGWDENSHYAGGSWAPSIRYHAKQFWVYFCTPDEGLFMSRASSPYGPWSELHCVKSVPRWEDPCPIWDDDGEAYLAHSLHGAGPIIIHKMSKDGTQLLDDGVTVYRGPVAEGPKFYKLNGYYYISIPEGGVSSGWQTVLRAKNIYGPYESKRVLEMGSTNINGPHQGSLVETPEGEWWFYHFQETKSLGRVVHLQPVSWSDGWPVIGVDYDGNGVGEPVYAWKNPSIKQKRPIEPHAPQSSDDFNSPKLGLQWQWNHNPHNDYWSLSNRPGHLTLMAQNSAGLISAHNTLTQKSTGYIGTATTLLETDEMSEGQRAGLVAMGNMFYGIGVLISNGKRYIYIDAMNMTTKMIEIDYSNVCLSVSYNATQTGEFQFSYGPTIDSMVQHGESITIRNGFWKGCRLGLYTYNTISDSGKAHFDWFNYPIIK